MSGIKYTKVGSVWSVSSKGTINRRNPSRIDIVMPIGTPSITLRSAQVMMIERVWIAYV